MIELTYYCPGCMTYISRWYPAGDEILQPDQCLFCGSDDAHVYISDLGTESNEHSELLLDVLDRTQQAIDQEQEISNMMWEDPAYFDS